MKDGNWRNYENEIGRTKNLQESFSAKEEVAIKLGIIKSGKLVVI